MAKKAKTKVAKKKVVSKRKGTAKKKPASRTQSKYPRHSIKDALRIPSAILSQNAGKVCAVDQAAKYLGLKSAAGPFGVEISSGVKYGLLERPENKKVKITDLGRQILRTTSEEDVAKGHQKAVLNAPVVSEVYKHYRGENLPESQFFDNALEDTFGLPKDKVPEFKAVLLSSLRTANLLDENEGRIRILDSASSIETEEDSSEYIEKLSSGVPRQLWRFLFRDDAVCVTDWRSLFLGL